MKIPVLPQAGWRCALGVLALFAQWASAPAQAHEGHDHGAQAMPVPARPGVQADGSVVLPLAQQAGLHVREFRSSAAQGGLVAARVIPDPGHSAQLRAPRSGELIEPPGGFPMLGRPVAKGAVIAWLKPAFDRAQHSDLVTDLARLEKEQLIAEQKLQQFSVGITSTSALGMSPQFMQLKADAQSLKARREEYQKGLARREALRAPVAGVLSRSDLGVGRVVKAGESLGELIEPRQLWLTALDPEAAHTPPARTYALTPRRERVEVELVGVSQRLVGQAVPLQYRIVNPPAGLAVGQALILNLARPGATTPVPAGALVGADRTRVWVQTAAERFALKPVAALAPGDRVVVQPNARLRALQPR